MEKNSVNNKIIHSFRDVDLSAIAIPSIAIYKHPRDIPDKYVARVYACSSPTNVIMLADSAEELRKDIEGVCKPCIWFDRMQGDPKNLVGVYIL